MVRPTACWRPAEKSNGSTIQTPRRSRPFSSAIHKSKPPKVSSRSSTTRSSARRGGCRAVRARTGRLRVLAAGKDYFHRQNTVYLARTTRRRAAVAARTGHKYMVYFSERLHVESAVFAGELIRRGEIGRVIQVLGLGPHRLTAPSRPGWFFELGKIRRDFVRHRQPSDRTILVLCRRRRRHRRAFGPWPTMPIPNTRNWRTSGKRRSSPTTEPPTISGWIGSPRTGLRTWGDGRTFILGTNGYIELRKYIDVAAEEAAGDHVLLVNGQGEAHHRVAGKVGYPFFGQLILDCLNRTEHATDPTTRLQSRRVVPAGAKTGQGVRLLTAGLRRRLFRGKPTVESPAPAARGEHPRGPAERQHRPCARLRHRPGHREEQRRVARIETQDRRRVHPPCPRNWSGPTQRIDHRRAA